MTHEHAPATTGHVALDIGAGRGALVVRTDAARRGEELEISPADSLAARQHVWLLERGAPGSDVVAAVFGSLPAGDYMVWLGAGAAGAGIDSPRRVTVEAGRVTTLDARPDAAG